MTPARSSSARNRQLAVFGDDADPFLACQQPAAYLQSDSLRLPFEAVGGKQVEFALQWADGVVPGKVTGSFRQGAILCGIRIEQGIEKLAARVLGCGREFTAQCGGQLPQRLFGVAGAMCVAICVVMQVLLALAEDL